MAFTREVITLQIGNYTNYVGTHWWNIQVNEFTSFLAENLKQKFGKFTGVRFLL